MEWNGMENVLGLTASLLAGRSFKNPFKRLLKTPLVLGQPHTLSVMIDEGHLPTGKGQHLDLFNFSFFNYLVMAGCQLPCRRL